ncbi:RecB family exonuclease [Chloroflexota bacterium]
MKRVLEMEALDDQKAELDALDFGSLVHDVLYEMACNEEMRECEDIVRLQDFLCSMAADWIKERLGSSPPVQVEAQIESARQRLRRAAEVQVALVREGWEIIGRERMIEGVIEGMSVRGKIDRIDRHRQTGRIRVLDYKTSEKALDPEEAHLGPLSKDREYPEYSSIDISGRQRRWKDLQLPLYILLLSHNQELQGPFEPGYFNLPRSINDTGVVLWKDFSAELLESAERCARGVASDIRNLRFWPPSEKVLYDDFDNLFTSSPALCINAESFELFTNRGRML